jgi:uncharacterized membrane protein
MEASELTQTGLNRRLQVSGSLVSLGLLIEAVCLLWARPLAFIVLVAVGGLLILAGIFVYLYSLVSFKDQSVQHQERAS